MISNTDSTLLIYSVEYIRVKAYKRHGGGRVELEQMDPSDPPLDVDRIRRDRHRQLRCLGARRWDASAMDHLLAPASARLAPVHGSVFVRAPVCDEVAHRAPCGLKTPAKPT